MTVRLIIALIAVVAFLLAAVGKDDGRGVPIGLLALTILLAFAS
jgi:hypothetical protein